MPEPAMIAGVVTNIFLVAGLWIREYFKHKDWKKKNGGIGRIETAVNKIEADGETLKKGQQKNDKDMGIIKKKGQQKNDKDMGIIKTELKNVHENCKTQVATFSQTINQNSQEILALAKEKADK